VKSLNIGERDAWPLGFDLAPGEAGPLKIVASTKTAQVKVTVAGAPAGGVTILLVPADPERFAGLQMAQGVSVSYGIPPGRYRVFAVDIPNAWELAQKPDVLKALESQAQTVELEEGETAEVTADLIPASDLKQPLQDAQ
jgi:hypothetical protein